MPRERAGHGAGDHRRRHQRRQHRRRAARHRRRHRLRLALGLRDGRASSRWRLSSPSPSLLPTRRAPPMPESSFAAQVQRGRVTPKVLTSYAHDRAAHDGLLERSRPSSPPISSRRAAWARTSCPCILFAFGIAGGLGDRRRRPLRRPLPGHRHHPHLSGARRLLPPRLARHAAAGGRSASLGLSARLDGRQHHCDLPAEPRPDRRRRGAGARLLAHLRRLQRRHRRRRRPRLAGAGRRAARRAACR